MLRGQFTYTATSQAGVWDRTPGWKIQSAVGTPGSPTMSEQLVRRAARNIGGFLPPAVPELATRAHVDGLPRCLRLDVVDDDLVCLSHLVAAGPDYSGRANFYAHSLLVTLEDQEADEEGFLRPADLWGAEFWLRPLGSRDVEATQPDEAMSRLQRGPLHEGSLDEFMRTRPNQRDMVLAAFERRLLGGGPLVLVTDDPESVVQWLRLIGQLLLPSTAWRLPFSTYERAMDTQTPGRWPFALVGVPVSDAATALQLPGAHFAVLQDGEAPQRAGVGRWAMPGRSELVAGPWSRLAESVVLTGLLSAVAEKLDDLAIEVGSSTVDRPLWALPAAVLMLEDLPFDELAADAAELVLAHWPPRLAAGKRTTDLLFRHLREHIDAAVLADALRARAGATFDNVVTQLLYLEPLREALSSPDAYRRLAPTLPAEMPPLMPAVRADLDDSVAEALRWVAGAGELAPRALLQIAAFTGGEGQHSGRIIELAKQLLVPRLLDPDIDPVALAWPQLPLWLWDALRPALAVELAEGDHLPGRAFAPPVYGWLGRLPRPRGDLDVAVLRAMDATALERSAFAVFHERPRPRLTPLDRAAAFLATVHNRAVNEGRPDARRAARAADEVYSRPPLRLDEAIVLMECVPDSLPFGEVMIEVLRRSPGDRLVAETIDRLRARERLLPIQEQALNQLLASADDVLVQGKDDLRPLLNEAQRFVSDPATWTAVGDAVLRLDAARMPIHGLPTQLDEPDFPWEAAFHGILVRYTEPGERILLAANLIVRGARAQAYPRDDQAAAWLVSGTGSAGPRFEAAANSLVAGLDGPGDLGEKVGQLVSRVPARANPFSSQRAGTTNPDLGWRKEAVQAAARIGAGSAKAPTGQRPSPSKRRLRLGAHGDE